jgi:hypothetical protein
VEAQAQALGLLRNLAYKDVNSVCGEAGPELFSLVSELLLCIEPSLLYRVLYCITNLAAGDAAHKAALMDTTIMLRVLELLVGVFPMHKLLLRLVLFVFAGHSVYFALRMPLLLVFLAVDSTVLRVFACGVCSRFTSVWYRLLLLLSLPLYCDGVLPRITPSIDRCDFGCSRLLPPTCFSCSPLSLPFTLPFTSPHLLTLPFTSPHLLPVVDHIHRVIRSP